MIRNNFKSVAFVNLLSLSIFILLLIAVIARTDIVGLDGAVSDFVFSHFTKGMTAAALFFTSIGDLTSIAIISAVAIGYFLGRKRADQVIVLATTLVATNLFVRFMKFAVERERPDHAFYFLSDPSFPSGHATIAAAFFTLLYLLLAKDIHSSAHRFYLGISLTVLALLIGFSRVALNVHWITDVGAGLSLGVFLGTLGYTFFLIESKFFTHRKASK